MDHKTTSESKHLAHGCSKARKSSTCVASNNSEILQNDSVKTVLFSPSYRWAKWGTVKSKWKGHGPRAGKRNWGSHQADCSKPLLQSTTHPPCIFSKQDFMKVTCKHIATLTLDPKVVLTARGDRPMSLKSLEKDCWRAIRGRSSATTTHVRMQERLIPLVCKTPSTWAEVSKTIREVNS